MRVRLKWSSIASAALVVSACSSPRAGGLFNPVSTDGDSGAGGDASSGENAGAGGAEDANCGSGGVAGGGGSSGAAAVGSGGVAGGGGSSGAGVAGAVGSVASNGGGSTTTTAGVCGGAGGSSAGANNAGVNSGGVGGSIAGAGNGGTAGGSGGNGTGGMLSKCELLLLQANAHLQGAQTCSTASGEAFCTGYATNECGCKVPVNKGESVATENYVKARDTFKNECSATCTTPCVEPKSQTCQLIFGLVVGSCVAM